MSDRNARRAPPSSHCGEWALRMRRYAAISGIATTGSRRRRARTARSARPRRAWPAAAPSSPPPPAATLALEPPMSVRTQPGCIALTRMPSPASSLAVLATNALTAAFEMRYGSEPPRMPEVNWPIVEETTTIRAWPAARSDGSSACVRPTGASTLTAKQSSISLRERVGDAARGAARRRCARARAAAAPAARPAPRRRRRRRRRRGRPIPARRRGRSRRGARRSRCARGRAPARPPIRSAVTIAGPMPRPVPVTSAVCPSRSIPVA